jgi:hypothetical protein
MKRVIGGKSYNTDTATVIASWEYKDGDGYDTEAELYRTKGGAFFAVHEWVVEEGIVKVYFEEMTRAEVDRLVERTDNLEIYDEQILAAPPEAEAEEEEGSTIYGRVPTSLKARIEADAKAKGLSVNAWLIRCAERCLTPAA